MGAACPSVSCRCCPSFGLMSLTPADVLRTLRLAPSHVLIEAGAGSGKTTALVDKIRYELGLHPEERPEQPLQPSQIVAMTFTRKAAAELRERLRRQVLRDAAGATGAEREQLAAVAFALDQMMLGTLDQFALDLVRRFGPLQGMPSDLRVISEGEARLVARPLVEPWLEQQVAEGRPGAALLVRQFGVRGAVEWLTTAILRPDALATAWRRRDKQQGLGWATRLSELTGGTDHLNETDRALEPVARTIVDLGAEISSVVRTHLLDRGVLTLSQIQHEAARLLREPAIVASCQARWKLVCVDEHQDTSALQARLLFQLAALNSPTVQAPGAQGTRMVFVGDPKQGIYGFRGADITMWRETARRVLEARGTYLQLRHNHRSHPQLVQTVDALMGRILNEGRPASDPVNRFEVGYSPLMPARTAFAGGGRVEVVIGTEKGITATAQRVARQVAQMLAQADAWPVQTPDGTTRPLRAEDIAVLVRKLSGRFDAWQAAFTAAGLQLQIRAGISLWSRPEVRDIEALLTVVADPSDRMAWATFLRSPLAGLDDVVVTRVLSAAHPESQLAADATGARVAAQLGRWRALAGRVPAGDLLRLMLEETGFLAWAAGQSDGEAAVRSLERMVEMADGSAQPLATVARQLATRRATADREQDGDLPVEAGAVQLLTIHGAKGLEWPVVIIPEMDAPVLPRAFQLPTEPTFDADFGLLLPLGAIDPAAGRTLAPSRVLKQYELDQGTAQYAEVKRLLYVGLTRARDHLVLETVLKGNYIGGPVAVPRQLAEGPQWRHTDAIERWMRFCWPSLCQTPAAGPADLPYVTVRQGDALQLAATVAEAAAAAAGRGSSSAEGPPAVTPPRGAVPLITLPPTPTTAPARSALQSPMAAVRYGKRVWSATELKVFRDEPWRHWWQFRHSVSTPRLALNADDQRLLLTPALRGTILHQVFSEQPDAATTAVRLAQLVRRHLQVGGEELDRMVASLMRHVEGLAAAGLSERLAAARQVQWSVPFTVALDGAETMLTGEFDLLIEEPDGRWSIVDFKTLEVPSPVVDLPVWIQPRVAEHELQLGLYTVALAAMVGWDAVGSAELLFTYWGHRHSFPVTEAWAEAWRQQALETIARIRADDYGPLPTYRESLCASCAVRTMCRPAGDPLLLVGDTEALAGFQQLPASATEGAAVSGDASAAASAAPTRRRQRVIV